MDAERKLFRSYFFSSISLLVSTVTFSVPWGHWSYTLDRCVGEDCGCILYGKAFADTFYGGSTGYCLFITCMQIIILIISIILTFYHGVRVYIKPRRAMRENQWRGNPLLAGSRRKKSSGDVKLPELDPPSLPGIICLLINSLLLLISVLTVLGFFMDGFIRSCDEYRRTLVRNLHASGRFAYIINNRLACPSIFDFMDYLQPDRRSPDDALQYMRRDRINTGLSLLLTNSSLIINSINWIRIVYLNFKLLLTRQRNQDD